MASALIRDLRDNLGVELENKRILILGAGGATRGILAPLIENAAQRAGHRQPHTRAG